MLQQRKLMRDIRKQQRQEEKRGDEPGQPYTRTPHKTPTRLNKQLTSDRRKHTRERAVAQLEEVEKRDERTASEEEEEDDDFVPLQSKVSRLHSASRDGGRSADKSGRRERLMEGLAGHVRDIARKRRSQCCAAARRSA